MESVGSYRYHSVRGQTRHHLWVRMDVVPPLGQSLNEFYACAEAFCAVKWGIPSGPGLGFDNGTTWKKKGSSFFFLHYDDMVTLVQRMQQGFEQRDAQVLLLKRKLILGNLIDPKEKK